MLHSLTAARQFSRGQNHQLPNSKHEIPAHPSRPLQHTLYANPSKNSAPPTKRSLNFRVRSRCGCIYKALSGCRGWFTRKCPFKVGNSVGRRFAGCVPRPYRGGGGRQIALDFADCVSARCGIRSFIYIYVCGCVVRFSLITGQRSLNEVW